MTDSVDFWAVDNLKMTVILLSLFDDILIIFRCLTAFWCLSVGAKFIVVFFSLLGGFLLVAASTAVFTTK